MQIWSNQNVALLDCTSCITVYVQKTTVLHIVCICNHYQNQKTGAGTLVNHMAIIVWQKRWHVYAEMQEYQNTKQTILLELRMPPGFLILMLMNNLSWSLSSEGIRSYKRTSVVQREKLSDILNCSKKPCLQEDTEGCSLSCDVSAKPQHSLWQQQVKCAFQPGNFNLHQCGSVTINFNTNSSNCNTEN